MPLPINYRSTKSIVSYCQEIAPIQNETVTGLTTPNEQGAPPEFKLYPMESEEATAVINGCLDIGNTAILARTNRQLAPFEDECAQRNIRYKLLGKSGFWSQAEVKDAVAILGSVVMPTNNNLLRMLSARCDATKFLRKVDTRDTPSTVKLVERFAEEHGEPLNRLLTRFTCADSMQADTVKNIGYTLMSLRADIKSRNGKDAFQMLVDRFGLLSHYNATEDEDDKKNFDNDPKENILKLQEYASRHNTLDKFYEQTQRARKAMFARSNCLILSTIHQAKGKEWKKVFVVGVNEDVLPHSKGDEAEERRIYFVACSRAAHELVVSSNGVPSILIQDRLPKDTAGKLILEKNNQWEGFQLQA